MQLLFKELVFSRQVMDGSVVDEIVNANKQFVDQNKQYLSMVQDRGVGQIEADDDPLKTIQSSYQMQAAVVAKKDWKLLFEMVEKSQ